MRTDDLIAALSADAKNPMPDMSGVWVIASLCAIALAGLVFVATIGPRPDFLIALSTVRFNAKFVLTLGLVVTSFGVMRSLAMPGAPVRRNWLLVVPMLGLLSVVLELMALPRDAWSMAWTGKNALVCLTFIPLIGILPLGAMLVALRRAAPTHPMLAGAVAGLVAGGIAASFYAAHCTDDSPLFVMTFYPMAIAMLAGAGALVGRIVLRW
jgi:hypothetical protein